MKIKIDEEIVKRAYAELRGYHLKYPLPKPTLGYVCQGRITLELLGMALGYCEPGDYTDPVKCKD